MFKSCRQILERPLRFRSERTARAFVRREAGCIQKWLKKKNDIIWIKCRDGRTVYARLIAHVNPETMDTIYLVEWIQVCYPEAEDIVMG